MEKDRYDRKERMHRFGENGGYLFPYQWQAIKVIFHLSRNMSQICDIPYVKVAKSFSMK